MYLDIYLDIDLKATGIHCTLGHTSTLYDSNTNKWKITYRCINSRMNKYTVIYS